MSTMSNKKKIVIILAAVLGIAGIAVLIIWVRTLGPKDAAPASPKPVSSSQARGFSKDRFGPHIRAQQSSNVDIGVRTVRSQVASPSPSSPPKRSDAGTPVVQLAQFAPAPNYATPNPLNNLAPLSQPSPSIAPVPTQPPVLPPLQFEPLAPAPAAQDKELVVVYSRGDSGKRQIWIRSVDREKDDQLVYSAFDDYGVSFSGTTQKVAFYSDEEGPSDATRARSKLKVVDLLTGKVTPIASGLPGVWPAAWSPDGKKLAIPTQNSIYIADVTNGTSLQVPTGRGPGAITWAPGNLQFYYQAEAATRNIDIYVTDAITAQPKSIASTPKNETYPSVSADGNKLAYLREQEAGGNAVATRSTAGGEETTFAETNSASSYLWNLEFNQLVFVKGDQQSQLHTLKDKVSNVLGDLVKPVVVAWDRDYGHVFVLADDDKGRSLFTVDIKTGQAEKVKTGISDSLPPPQ